MSFLPNIRSLSTLLAVMSASLLHGQSTMNIHNNNGTISQYDVADIDSVVYWVYPQPDIMWVYLSDGSSPYYYNSSVLFITYSEGGPAGSPWPVTIGSDSVTFSTAVVTAHVGSAGSSAVTERGICWDTLVSPTIADHALAVPGGVGTYTGKLTGLLQGKTYHARAYATNSYGTAYGNEITFQTWLNPWLNEALDYGTVMDVDGNTYHTIAIGNQTWMAEDLRASHYANGDPITHVPIYTSWPAQTAGAWALYDFYDLNEEDNGRYYNWFAVADPRNVCPSGWHTPSETEFTELISNAPGGGPLKSSGTYNDGTGIWSAPNTGATNATGFTALPMGNITYMGSSGGEFSNVFFWTSTAYDSQSGKAISLAYNSSSATQLPTVQFQDGMKVRCLMD